MVVIRTTHSNIKWNRMGILDEIGKKREKMSINYHFIGLYKNLSSRSRRVTTNSLYSQIHIISEYHLEW